MLRTLLLAGAALGVTVTPAVAAPAKRASSSATLPASNPFAKPSMLPFQAPDFSKIKDADYLPAFLAGMAEQKREVAAIANNPAEPTFNNTMVALERSGALLDRVQAVFGAVNGANTNDTLQATDTKTAPLLAQHDDYIYLNTKLFRRVETLYNKRASLGLNPEQARLLQVYYDDFVKAGAKLDHAKQSQLKQLNSRISALETQFAQKLLAAGKAGALHVTDKAALAGLSEDRIAAAAEAAKDRKVEGYVLPLQNTTQQPAGNSLTDRATREALYKASVTRAS
jgi:peptidyl-dipeptidase Dcp